VPDRDDPGLAAHLPEGAVHHSDGWRFPVADGGVEAALKRLIDGGYGIAGLSIERPGLHDAFVRIVGASALEGTQETAA